MDWMILAILLPAAGLALVLALIGRRGGGDVEIGFGFSFGRSESDGAGGGGGDGGGD